MPNGISAERKYPPIQKTIADYRATGREPGFDGRPPEHSERKTLVWEDGKRVAGTSPFNNAHSTIEWLFAHKRIEQRQKLAAERLACDWQLSAIDPIASNVMVGAGSSAGDMHPNDKKRAAMRRHGDAHAALGRASKLVALVVEENHSVEKAAAEIRVHTKYAHGMLGVALHFLADHYKLA